MKLTVILATKVLFWALEIQIQVQYQRLLDTSLVQSQIVIKSSVLCFSQPRPQSVDPEDSALSIPETVQMEEASRVTGYDPQEGGVYN